MGDEVPEGDAPLPANLRFLRGLVTVLTAVMILGVIAIVALLVIRLSDDGAPRVVLVTPEGFALPDGVAMVGYSVVDGFTVIVGNDGAIRVFDSETQALLETHTLPE